MTEALPVPVRLWIGTVGGGRVDAAIVRKFSVASIEVDDRPAWAVLAIDSDHYHVVARVRNRKAAAERVEVICEAMAQVYGPAVVLPVLDVCEGETEQPSGGHQHQEEGEAEA